MSDGHIYIMRFHDRTIKVGFSVDVNKRRKDLKWGWHKLDIMRVWRMNYLYGRFVEREAHRILRPFLCSGYEIYRTSLKRSVEAVECALDRAKGHHCLRTYKGKDWDVHEMKISKCRRRLA